MNHFLNLKDSRYSRHSFAFYLWSTLLTVSSLVAMIFTLVAVWTPGVSEGASGTAVLFWFLAIITGVVTAFIAYDE